MLVACLVDQVGTQTTLARAVAYAADPSTEVAGADPADGADILVSSLGPNGADWDLTERWIWRCSLPRRTAGLVVDWRYSGPPATAGMLMS